MTAPATLYAYDVQSDGRAARLDAPNAPRKKDAAYRWLHFDLNEPGVADWIETATDPIVAEALTREDTRPRCSPHEAGLIIILRGVNLNPNSDPEDMVSIRLWIGPGLIISTRVRRLMAVTGMNDAMASDQAPPSTGAFIARLAAGLTERMDPVVSDLADRIDALEEASVDRTEGLRSEIADIRRSTIALRRYIAPQKDALWKLATGQLDLIDAAARGSLRETGDQVLRLVEELDAVRERSAILNDQLTDKRAEEMNATMLLLSVVAAIFLPLGFLTGLLGINVGGMPGADWSAAFWLVCGLCLGIAGALVWMFKRRGWI
jgi:zinc transporter